MYIEGFAYKYYFCGALPTLLTNRMVSQSDVKLCIMKHLITAWYTPRQTLLVYNSCAIQY